MQEVLQLSQPQQTLEAKHIPNVQYRQPEAGGRVLESQLI
jgi:hypothetical protein